VRLRLALLLALALAGGAVAADRVSPASPKLPASLSAAPAAGILSCPYLTDPRATSYIELANIGTSPAEARVGISAQKGSALTIPVVIPAGGTSGVRVPGTASDHSSAVIEYSGGPVVASHILFVPQATIPAPRPAGAAAASCGRAGGSDVAVTGATTFGSDANLALFNPGSADADVTVTLIADGRIIQPLRLAQRIVPAHTRRDFRLGDFAFNVRALTAVVHANVGRVGAEILQRSGKGVELLAGQAPSTQAVAISGQSGDGATVGLAVTGSDDAGVDASLISGDQQTSVAGIPPDLPPASSRVLQIPARAGGAPAAYMFEVTVGSPVVASTTWTSASGGSQDTASLPAATPASKWGAVVAAFDPGASTRAVIVNPEGSATHVHVTTIGPKGLVVQDLTLPAGRLTDIVVGRGPGTFAVLVDADGPVVLALRSVAFARGRSPESFAVVGEPFTPPTPEAVLIDPRAGVPAVVQPS